MGEQSGRKRRSPFPGPRRTAGGEWVYTVLLVEDADGICGAKVVGLPGVEVYGDREAVVESIEERIDLELYPEGRDFVVRFLEVTEDEFGPRFYENAADPEE